MDGTGAPVRATDVYAPEDVLELKEVTDYMQRAFSVFELDRAHDWRNIYSYICYSIAEEWRTALPKEDSARGHFKLVNRAGRGRWTKRVSKDAEERDYYSISLSLSDTIWVLAGVHVLLNHQKINIVEKNLAALKIDVSSKIVRNLLDYCVDCSLRLFGDRLSSQALDYMNKHSHEREDPEFGKMSNSEVRRSVLKHYKDDSLDPRLQELDPARQMEFKNFYMGALLSACAGRTTPFTNVLYVGFIHYDSDRDILFCIDHDTGLLRAVTELLRVHRHNESGAYSVAHKDLQNALRNMFKATCNDDTRLVNVNIDEVAEFDVLPCSVYHWVGEWYEKRDPNKTPRRRLPDVLCSALDRFLYVLNNPDLVRQDPFWNFDEDCYGANWFTTVVWKYPESQWTLFSDRYCNLAFNFTTTPRRTVAIDEAELRSCVPVSEAVERYVSNVTLQSDRHNNRLDRIQTRMDKYSNEWLNSSRHGAQYFNFEFMERPVNESILENYQFRTPRKSLDTIKALFYVFVFKRIKDVMKDDAIHSLDMTAREEIFEKYWTYFHRNAYDFIKQHVNAEPGEDDDDEDPGLNGEQQQQLVDEIVYKQHEIASPESHKRQRTA